MMTPTMRLRWRVLPGTSTQPPVLQQWWDEIDVGGPREWAKVIGGEWRDVPFEASADSLQNSEQEKS
jgi:hypothetical protein